MFIVVYKSADVNLLMSDLFYLLSTQHAFMTLGRCLSKMLTFGFIAILAHVSCLVNLSNLLLSQIEACLQHVFSILLMKCVLIIVCAMNYGMRV